MKIYSTNRLSGEFTDGDNGVILAIGKESGRLFLDNFEGHHTGDGFFLIRKNRREGLNVSSFGRFNGNDFDDIFGQLGIKLEGNEITLENGVCLRACCNR